MKKDELIEIIDSLGYDLADVHSNHDMRVGDDYVPCTSHNMIAKLVDTKLVDRYPEETEEEEN
jgi:hypothetical protein